MRKNFAWYAMAIAVALAASTLALPAERSVDRGSDAALELRAARHAGSFTIQGLLHGRLDWTLRMTRALRRLEQAPEPQPSSGTRTIIDEPDPAGLTKDSAPPPPPEGDDGDGSSDNSDEHQNGANEFKQPLRALG
jgi:hypothetical protein